MQRAISENLVSHYITHITSVSVSGNLYSHLFHPHVPEPHREAVVLEADMSLAGKILQCEVKLVLRTVGIFMGRRPAVEVRHDDLNPVQFDHDIIHVTGDDRAVPFSGGLHGVEFRGDHIVDGAG